MWRAILVVVLAVVLVAGCATILKGNGAKLNASSKSTQAEVWVDGTKVGETPLTFKLTAGKSHRVELRKPDGTVKDYNLEPFVGGGWIVADIICGGLVSVVVDAVTGSWSYLEPRELTIENPVK